MRAGGQNLLRVIYDSSGEGEMNKPETIAVPRELFDHMVDYLGELLVEQSWKKDSINRYDAEYRFLEDIHKQAVEMRDG